VRGANLGDGLPPLREVIAAHGLSARKSLGQNFILDLNLTRRIAREAGIAGSSVYEVGPGPGGLTRALFAEGAARVIAVERDRRALPALAEIAATKPGQLDIVEADALAVDEKSLLIERGLSLPMPVVANLPFNLGTALLVKWLSADWPALVGQSADVSESPGLCEAGDDAYGRLSVLAQWRSHPASCSMSPAKLSCRRPASPLRCCASIPCRRRDTRRSFPTEAARPAFGQRARCCAAV
jgi:16S rRNA (adenine1518-N6/adenine1519-N6)-dimethyltransferase